MKTASLLLLLVLSCTLSAQNQRTYTEEDLRALSRLGAGSTGVQTIDTRYEGVKGSPFLADDWQKGSFKLKDQETFGQELAIRLDLRQQQLYFGLATGFRGALPIQQLAEVRVHTGAEAYRLFRVYPEAVVDGSNSLKQQFYEVLHEGSFLLLKHHYKIFREADYKGGYSADRRYDEYIHNTVLWLQEAGKGFEKIKLKRKSIEQALPTYADKIKKVMKEKKISLRDEAGLIRLLNAL